MTTTPDIRQLIDAHVGDLAIGSEGEVLAVLRDTSDLCWQLVTSVDGKGADDWMRHDALHPFVSVVLTSTQLAAAVNAGLKPEPVPSLGDRLAGWGRNTDVPARSRLEAAAESLTIEQARGLLRLADTVRERLEGMRPTVGTSIGSLQLPHHRATPTSRPIRDEPQA